VLTAKASEILQNMQARLQVFPLPEGAEFTDETGTPGDFYASNLTPFHLGGWTDGEIYQAITTGVFKR
jgi:hypothetical protein